MILYLDGRLYPDAEAALTPSDRGFTLGDGLFETIKAKDGRPLRLEAHMARLRAGAALLRLELPPEIEQIETIILRLLDANTLSDAALRLTISRGPGVRGLLPPRPMRPTMLLNAGPLPPVMGPARAVVARSVRRDPFSPLTRCKSLSYLDNVLARMEAEERGGDEALLLNIHGRVVESTIANLFVVTESGAIVTPPISEGALPGVRRAQLLRELAVQERPLSPEAFLSAREAFLTNALSIRPLGALDGSAIGNGEAGPLTRRLMAEMERE